jgi:hypothetical protein
MKPIEEREAKGGEKFKLTHYRRPGRRSLYATWDRIVGNSEIDRKRRSRR